MNPPIFRTRRQFLRTGVLGGAFAWSVPAFLHRTILEMDARAADSLTQALSGRDGPILVVLQLAGGNDGLNTVIPLGNDEYHKARPTLAIADTDALRLDDTLGIHPQLAKLKELYDNGLLAVVNGVGYPNPNRSHFRSTEIWHTASDANRFERHGWIGRYFDNQCKGCDPTVGVAIASQMPQAFTAATPTGISFNNPETYRYVPGGPAGQSMAEEFIYREINKPDPAANAGGSIGALTGAVASDLSAADFLERTALDAQVSSDRLRAILEKGDAGATGVYPQSALAQQFQTVSRLIAGGLPTRVYYISQGGYDTHTNQKNSHDRLLGEFAEAATAFVADMKGQGNLGRVLVMVFSEFGRRVAENASGGTDHGAAAPMFLLGGGLEPGAYGGYPSLEPKALVNGDLAFGTDFRAVYAGVLEDWLRCDSIPILGRKFDKLRFVRG